MSQTFKAVLLILAFWGLGRAQTPPAPYEVDGERYDIYRNARFGFVLPYPAERVVPQPAEEDGRVFTSPDGQVTLWAFGTSTAPAESIEALFDEISTATAERSVTYEALGDGWFVVSGFKGDHVYYLKVLMPTRCAAMIFFHVQYPRQLKPVYDPITAEISDSFRATNCSD